MANISYKLIDTRTGQEIDEQKIVSKNMQGVLIDKGNGWAFVPADVILELAQDAKGSYLPATIPELPNRLIDKTFHQPVAHVSVPTEYEDRAGYYFGLDSIELAMVKPLSNSGNVLKNIKVGKCSHLKISADIENDAGSAVEFYILEGNMETAILPIEQVSVVGEKLFSHLPTRFAVDKNKIINVKKDGQTVKTDLDDLSGLKLSDEIYTVDYTALGDPYTYYPQADDISIKIIFRSYDQKLARIFIKNLVVRKYGGGIPWII